MSRWHRCCDIPFMRTNRRLLASYVSILLCTWSLPLDARTAHRKAAKVSQPTFSAARTNDKARRPRLISARTSGPSVLRAQILLDRAHFSPGEIDGHYGVNTRRAVAAFNQAHQLKGGERVDAATWAELNRDAAP